MGIEVRHIKLSAFLDLSLDIHIQRLEAIVEGGQEIARATVEHVLQSTIDRHLAAFEIDQVLAMSREGLASDISWRGPFDCPGGICLGRNLLEGDYLTSAEIVNTYGDLHGEDHSMFRQLLRQGACYIFFGAGNCLRVYKEDFGLIAQIPDPQGILGLLRVRLSFLVNECHSRC